MIKLVSILKEMATDLSAAYPWKKISSNGSLYTFNAGDTKYEVKFIEEEEGLYERIYKPVNKDYKGTSTNEGKPISINATVMSITIDFLKSNKEWYLLTIHPIDSRRLNLVLSFIKNNLPKEYRYEESEGVISIYRKTDIYN